MKGLFSRTSEDDFKKVYDSLSDAVFRFCLSRISDREQALDITQETFLRFWNELSKNKPIKNRQAFLFTVARNLIIDSYRKKKSLSLESVLTHDAEDKHESLAFDAHIEAYAEAENLVRHINALDDIYRDAVYLRCVEEMKPKDIAVVIGQSVNVVSVRISRGLSLLRKLMHYDK